MFVVLDIVYVCVRLEVKVLSCYPLEKCLKCVTMVTKQNGLMSGEHKRHRPSSCSAVLLICSHQITAFVGDWFSLGNIGRV